MIPLDKENRLALNLIQALLGAPSRNFRRIGLRVEEESVGIQIILAEESDRDREEIADVILAFEALQQGPVPIELQVLIHAGDLREIAIHPRAVYLRRED